MEHEFYQCPDGCTVEHCGFCEGGLQVCTECGGAESTLTMDCPGEQLSEMQAKQIQMGLLDFYDERWLHESQRH